MKYDIAEVLEIKDVAQFLAIMQEDFEARVGLRRSFRITATPVSLGDVSANLDDKRISGAFGEPPKPAQPICRLGC